jgi:hypothetical protein
MVRTRLMHGSLQRRMHACMDGCMCVYRYFSVCACINVCGAVHVCMYMHVFVMRVRVCMCVCGSI